MAITPLPPPPSRSDDPANFSAKADALLGGLPLFVTEANAQAATINADKIASASSASQSAASAANSLSSSVASASSAAASEAAALAAQAAAGLPPLPNAGRLIKTNGVPANAITSTPQTLVSGLSYNVDTTAGGFNLTLPLSPVVGDFVWVSDYAGTLSNNNLTLLRNGSNTEGLAEDLIIDISGISVLVEYINTTKGWVMK